MYAAGQVVVNASQAGFSNDKNKQNKIVNEPNFQKVNEEYEKINIKNKNSKSEISDNKSKKCNIL
ncbi:hypothetical protein [Spiroplasma endosymbiont of Danaus chrysippus]|jgi:hypothetical protein|uniref:hypothetical protein n=1 Tax=Spiroplasma endosymbiont of Danaus chrysippus TaxID=2691041 RepID=UPI0013CDAB57|nr:hypothetical protein [Spiroplasma endosymbiont of Danaus chrysippus]CAB1054916.1 hypothetical protein [Spiroplasma endosymbiont of Danaus chrysippus]